MHKGSRGKAPPLYLSILFQKKTLCKGKLMISFNFLGEPGRSGELVIKKNHFSRYRMGRPKAFPFFGEGFSELHLAPDESLGRTRKNDPVVLELASDFRASG